MRPLKLTMNAFLSYGESQTVNFEDLGNEGLYLITGETGAGKTTIFDGVMYALYGSASGDLREDSMFRSKYARPESETSVELFFECNGKKYRIKRKPKYERPKIHGDGMTSTVASAELEYFDGKPTVTGINEVNNAIYSIIGLNEDQFSQIAMIAQGQFRELLIADTDKRIGIFRHIFSTGNYDALQKKVSEDFSIHNRLREDTYNSIVQDVSGILSEEDFNEKVQKNSELINENIIEPLKELIEKDEKELLSFNNEKEQLKKDLEKAVENVKEAEKYEANLKSKTALLTLINNKKEESKKAELAHGEALKGKEKIESLKAEETKEKEKLSDYEKLDELKKNEDGNKSLLLKLTDEEEKLNRKIESDKESLAKSEERSKELSGLDKTLLERRNEEKAIKDKTERALNVLKRFKELSNKEDEVKRAFMDSRDKYALYEKLDNTFKAYKDAYFKEQAGLLAMELKEDEKCPVCGSVHHPEPAKLSADAVDKKVMDEAETRTETARKNANNATTVYETKKADKDSYEKETVAQVKDIVSGNDINEYRANLSSYIDELNNDRKDLVSVITELETKVNEKEKLDKSIPELRKNIESSIDTLSKVIVNKTKCYADLSNIEKLIEELNKTLSFKDIDEANRYIASLVSEYTKLERLIEDTRKKADQLKNEVSGLNGQLLQINKEINDAKITDLNKEKEKYSELKLKEKDGEEKIKNLNTKLKVNETALNNLEVRNKEFAEQTSKYMWLSSLNDTLSGKSIDKNAKIMLETYIQQAYFDQIVSKANVRFEKMSQNHYTLSRIKDVTSSRRQSGLDLEVIDHYNGTRRSVKSLSGGEQFEASLSLALGLSDMVQESSAGVKLDCMFIDEGFGSLDDSTLDRAIHTLNDLGSSNRLVGIISHVNELERRIDKKIIVKKDGNGFSKATIVK